MQPIAYTYVYNEADILPWTLRAMLRQGVNVYALDNWSTDDTFDMLRSESQARQASPIVAVERWPHDHAPEWFDLDSILGRITELHTEHQPEWALLFGADEVLVSCWPDVPLDKALERVWSDGYNAVDFETICFHPVDDNWTPGHDPEEYFRYYTPGRSLPNLRAWRSDGEPITFVDGGHKVVFEGLRVYPRKFAILHYPFRTQAQAERKVFVERRPRYAPRNRAKGWHTHYDHIQAGYSFIKDPRGLRYFDPVAYFEEEPA